MSTRTPSKSLPTARFTWKNNKLFFGNKDTGYSIFEKVRHQGDGAHRTYYIHTPKGDSQDHYNFTRARDNAIRLYRRDSNDE